MTSKKNMLNVGAILLSMVIMLGVIIWFSLSADVYYFGFYSVLKVLTYGASMFFLYSVFSKKNIKAAATTLIVLFFLAGIVPAFERIKTFLMMFIGTVKGVEIPQVILEQIKTPSGIIFLFQLLFFIMLILLLGFSLYAIFNNKKYSFKEIGILFLLIAIAFATIEILENVYVFMVLLKSGFSFKLIVARTPIMVFQYFIVVYLANNLKNASIINLFYYITMFAYTLVIGINTIINAVSTSANYGYVAFLMLASIVVYLYCALVSYLIFKD